MKAMRARRVVAATHEHEFEAAPGLPEPLPAGERLLWQGAPDWKLLARHAFHVRKLTLYFALILAARALTAWSGGETVGASLLSALGLLPLALIALGLLSGMAWLSARTTRYTLTDRRIVMRVGIVLSLSFNLPLSRIAAADVRLRGHGGDIPLQLAGEDRIAYLHLWPHARPWHIARPQPMLRCLADAAQVAPLLAQAWRDCHPELAAAPAATPSRARPVPARGGLADASGSLASPG